MNNRKGIMKMLFFTFVAVFIVILWFVGLPMFKKHSPENRLLVDVINCKINGCKTLEADFHDYSGMEKVPSFIRWAQTLETVRFYIFELKDISELERLNNLKTVDISGISGIDIENIERLKAKGIDVQQRKPSSATKPISKNRGA